MANDLKKVSSAPHHDLCISESEDILVVIPEDGFKDTTETSQLTVNALQDYAKKLGKKCGLVIIVNNLMAQEPEARRVYADGLGPDLFFGIKMVVNNPMARIIGNLSLRLHSMRVPLSLVESVEAGVAQLETMRIE